MHSESKEKTSSNRGQEVRPHDFIEEVIAARDQNPGVNFSGISGDHILSSVSSALRFGRDPDTDSVVRYMIDSEVDDLVKRLHPSSDWSDSFLELTAYRIAQEAMQIGYEFDAEKPLIDQVIEFLRGLNNHEAIRFFTHHRDVEMARRANSFVQKSEVHKAEIKSVIRRAISEGILPEDFDVQRADDLIEKLQFRVPSDFLFYSGDNSYLRYEHALYSVTAEAEPKLGAASDRSVEAAAAVRSHEIAHALSGRSVVRSEGVSDTAAIDEKFEAYKFGLSFTIDKTLEPEYSTTSYKYGWLNEAVTELLATALRGSDISHSRDKEIKLLKLMLSKSNKPIPWELFVDAYFEDSNVDGPELLPKWNKLQDAIDEGFYPGFLEELDKVVRSPDGGLDVALESFNKN